MGRVEKELARDAQGRAFGYVGLGSDLGQAWGRALEQLSPGLRMRRTGEFDHRPVGQVHAAPHSGLAIDQLGTDKTRRRSARRPQPLADQAFLEVVQHPQLEIVLGGIRLQGLPTRLPAAQMLQILALAIGQSRRRHAHQQCLL